MFATHRLSTFGSVPVFTFVLFALAVSLHAGDAATSAPKSIVAALQPFVDSNTLAGAVTVVATKEKIVSLETVGYADIAAKAPMKEDTLFWIASMSKPITGAALMILVDEGKVNIDDPVEKYLPEYKNQVMIEKKENQVFVRKPARVITVRDVMSHTSGLPFMSRIESKIDSYTLSESAISYALTPLTHEPGSKWVYSNAGINTGGRIIEVVSGMPFDQFVEKRLFIPLGMKDTTFWPSESRLKQLAKCYKPNAAKNGLEETPIQYFTYPLHERKRHICPGGGYFSTARDVATFGRMVLNGGEFDGKRIISEASIKVMTSKQTGTVENGYGLGWACENKPTGGFGHGGALATDLWIDPQQGLVMVYLVQHAGYPGTEGKTILPAFKKAAVELFKK